MFDEDLQSKKEQMADVMFDYLGELNLDRLIELLLNAGFEKMDLVHNGFNIEDIDRVADMVDNGEEIG